MGDYILFNEQEKYTFVTIPKVFFTDAYKTMSSDAKILYGVLLDRTNLSKENEWYDELGRIYIIYSRENAQEYINVKKDKIISLFKELRELDLLEEIKQGYNQPNLLYVKKFKAIINKPLPNRKLKPTLPHLKGRSEKPTYGVSKNDHHSNNDENNEEKAPQHEQLQRDSEKPTSVHRKNRLPEVGKTDPNNTESINTESINQSINHNSELPDGLIDQPEIQEFEIEELKSIFEIDNIDIINNPMYHQALMLLQDLLNTRDKLVFISKTNKVSKPIFVERILKLRRSHFEYVFEVLDKQTHKINNMRNYLITSLYNSLTSMDSYYINRVNTELN